MNDIGSTSKSSHIEEHVALDDLISIGLRGFSMPRYFKTKILSKLEHKFIAQTDFNWGKKGVSKGWICIVYMRFFELSDLVCLFEFHFKSSFQEGFVPSESLTLYSSSRGGRATQNTTYLNNTFSPSRTTCHPPPILITIQTKKIQTCQV